MATKVDGKMLNETENATRTHIHMDARGRDRES